MSESEIRSAIAAEARERFLCDGIADTQMNEIAKRVGISRSTLYLYFPSKSSLVLHVSNELMQEIERQAVAYVASMRAADGYSALKHRLCFLLNYFQEHGEVINFLDKFDALYSDEYPKADESERYIETMQGGVRDLYSQIRSGQQDGSIRDDIAPNVLGSLLLNGLFGIMQRMLTRSAILEKEHSIHTQEVTDRFLSLMLAAVAGNPEK